ncbi:DUF917 domain-containing protein [Nocardioides alcanivorans]|uniref:DUF917 domain-containing protein n=1 Tax=Nocardioides alcanivorans TaxID=2897352 RepID=UPI001F46ABC5|nr:DUF917 domain-containing protein [Nocardioides alcanivorans]
MFATYENLRALADGASFFGSGGGGDCELGYAMAAHRTAQAVVPTEIVDVSTLSPSDLVVHVALFGSPEIVAEQLPSGDEFAHAAGELAARLGQRVGAIGTLEIGGVNALVPFLAATDLGVPVVDSDLMGRAFPQLTQTTAALTETAPGAMVLVGTVGTTVLLDGLKWTNADAIVANSVSSMGGSAAIALFGMSVETLSSVGILGSVTRAIRTGEALARLPAGASSSKAANALGAALVLSGRVLDVVLSPGGLRTIVLDDASPEGRIGRVDAINEYVRVATDGEIVAEVPDIIVVLDEETLCPTQVDEVRVGQRVSVLRATSSKRWDRTGSFVAFEQSIGMEGRR